MPTISRHANYTTSPASWVPAWQWEDLMGEESQVFVRIDSIMLDERGYWPGGRFFPDVVDQAGGQTIFVGASWGSDIRWQGGRTMWAITGVTRDVYGTPLPMCDVKLFRALDDTLQYRVTSDANGNFAVLTPYTDGHYIVSYLPGTPDVEGTTVRTLVGV